MAQLEFLGPGAAPVALPANHQLVLLPVAFPLMFGHGIPAGQLWKADIGAHHFLASLLEMSASAGADTRAFARWVQDSKMLVVWLDSVAADVSSFCLEFVPRHSIAQALEAPSPAHSSVTAESLSSFTWWIQTGTARRLHRDAIFGTMPTHTVASYKAFEDKQMLASQWEGGFMGALTLETFSPLYYLHPPEAETWRKRFGWHEFLDDSTVPPEVSEYLRVSIPFRHANWVPPALELKEEAEAAEAAQQPPTPNSDLARRRAQSAGRQQALSVSGVGGSTLFPPSSGAAGASSFLMMPQPGMQGAGLSQGNPVEILDTPQHGNRSAGPCLPHQQQPQRQQQGSLFPSGGGPTVSGPVPPAPAHVTPSFPPPLMATPGFGPFQASAPSAASQWSAPGLSSVGYGADPLAQTLHQAHSAQASAVGPALSNTQHQLPHNSFLPSLWPLQPQHPHPPGQFVQVVDSSGRNVRQRTDEALYLKRDPSTWTLEPSRRHGPPAFWFFSVFLATMGPSVQGRFVLAAAPVPPTWQLRPSPLQLSWLDTFLTPDVKGQEAYYHVIKSQRQFAHVSMSFGYRPDVGRAFFQDRMFKKFVAAKPWVSWHSQVMDDDAVPLSDTFTILHFFLLHPQLESLPLPAQGLTRAQFTKVLVNTQFLFAGATSMDGMASTMAAAGGSPHGVTLWQSGLQSLLEALELLDACGAVLGRWSKQATHCHVRGCF